VAETDASEFVRLDAALDRSLGALRATAGPLTVLFSGGVDSSLLAWELRAREGLLLLTVGTVRSPDFEAGRTAAARLGLPWIAATVGATELDRMAARLAVHLTGCDSLTRSVVLAIALALDGSPPGPAIVGQGIDELFLGYAHFRGLSPADASARSDADLDRLERRDWPLTQRVAAHLDRTVLAPYLDPGFVAAARAVAVERRLADPVPKAFFRAWAVHRGLPEDLARRPKRALQYGSGIDRLLRGRPHP